MKILEFQNAFSQLPVISRSEIDKYFPDLDKNSISRWLEKGYLTKLRNGFYLFKNISAQDEHNLFLIAGKIYDPSYISLESALSWYGIIPEGVFTITSVTTKKTRNFVTPIGTFDYKNVKKSLFFGVQLMPSGSFYFKMAEPIKAILDLLYLRTEIKESWQMESLRFHIPRTRQIFETSPWEDYLDRIDSKTLRKKVEILQKLL